MTHRELDKLICTIVYKEECIELNQKYGHNIDYVAKNKGSKANRPIYSMDMVSDYILKDFSQNKQLIFDLIEMINNNGKKIEFSQLDNEWCVSSWFNNYEKQYSVKHISLNVAICLLALKVYDYDIANINVV